MKSSPLLYNRVWQFRADLIYHINKTRSSIYQFLELGHMYNWFIEIWIFLQLILVNSTVINLSSYVYFSFSIIIIVCHWEWLLELLDIHCETKICYSNPASSTLTVFHVVIRICWVTFDFRIDNFFYSYEDWLRIKRSCYVVVLVGAICLYQTTT